MKPFKYICLLLSLVLLMLSVGCGDDESKTAGTPFFELSETPVTEPRSVVPVYSRVNAEYTDKLVPSDSYGELIPFVGALNTYKSTKEGSDKQVSVPVYGLCNLNGAVVVDAVYDAVKKHPKDEGGFVYELVIGSDGSDPTKGTRYVAASDGSWVFQIPKNCTFGSAGGERVILERTRTVKKVKYTYHDFYDHSGKRKFTFESKLAEDANTSYTIGAFSEGLAPVNITVKDPETEQETKTAYFIDNTGKKFFEKLTYCEEFRNGYAVVSDENGIYGVIDQKGEWFMEPKFRVINYNHTKGCFACADSGFVDILDMEKKQVKRIFTEKSDVEVLNSDRLIYKKTNPDTGREEYFYVDTDEPFTCVETGQFPDGNAPVEGLYVCVYSGTGTIFTEDGQNIASIGDFGELVDRFGNTAVVVNTNGKKTCFITVSTRQRTEWMRCHYTRQSVGDRYLVMQDPDTGTYSLYDLMTGTNLYENCDYIEACTASGKTLLSVVSNGTVTVCDSQLSPVLNAAAAARY